MSRLISEVRSSFSVKSSITFRNIATLPFLAAVIEESLRMYPPFVTSLARTVPQGGSMVDGQFVPENVCTRY